MELERIFKENIVSEKLKVLGAQLCMHLFGLIFLTICWWPGIKLEFNRIMAEGQHWSTQKELRLDLEMEMKTKKLWSRQ